MRSPTLHTIDLDYLGHPHTIAAYLLRDGDACALIETGPSSTSETLEHGLRSHAVTPDDVTHALVTHIHLDHAGAAGAWAKRGTQVFVHEFGAPHLIDPAKLINSATRIYGSQMDSLWGPIEPAPDERVTPLRDGDVVEVGSLRLTAVETPGHARHHHAFTTELGGERICFTGDAAGMFVPDSPSRFITLPTPPPEFDPDAWHASIDRLDAMGFDAIYPTHFGRVDDPREHLQRLRSRLDDTIDLLTRRFEAGDDDEVIFARYREVEFAAARAAGVPERLLHHFVSDNLLRMNITGVQRWWMKRREATGPADASR